MFTPVPPQSDPPPSRLSDTPDVPSIARPFPYGRSSRRGRIVKFALLGGGGASVGFGLVLGLIAWVVMPPEVVPFPSTDHFTFLSPEQRMIIWPFALTLLIAPFMILVFALAASAQVIAASLMKSSQQKTEPARSEGREDDDPFSPETAD